MPRLPPPIIYLCDFCLDKDFVEAFLQTQFPNDPPRAPILLSHFLAANKKFLSSLSLDDIERIATSYLHSSVGNINIDD